MQRHPNRIKWYTTRRWRLILNLILQPQTNTKFWESKEIEIVFAKLRKNSELDKKMKQICIKISSGYCARFEEEESLIIPIPIKKLIGKKYLFVEPSIFKASDEQIEWQSQYVVSRCEDGRILDTNPYPPTNSLLLQPVPSLSDDNN